MPSNQRLFLLFVSQAQMSVVLSARERERSAAIAKASATKIESDKRLKVLGEERDRCALGPWLPVLHASLRTCFHLC